MQTFTYKGINKSKPLKVYATLPVLNESENIAALLLDLEAQNFDDWMLVVCVNQPDEWWQIPDKQHICEDNARTIAFLEAKDDSRIRVIDRSSIGLGWKGKHHGVGWARKTAMDFAADLADADDVIVSMDADTRYPDNYFSSVVEQIHRFPEATGLSVPYYHKLTGDETADRCILRYEIYMRNYALHMLQLRNPYCFSAIGSGMACKSGVYKRVGGLTPKLSGEDFYFIQKLRKAGNIIVHCDAVIHPEARFSDRVYFGTGPAMIRGRDGKWDSYPIYCGDSFLKVADTFQAFADLYTADFEVPMQYFIDQMIDGNSFWGTLRNNSASVEAFVKACTQRLDGLRILQFLKSDNDNYPQSDEEKLWQFLNSALFSTEDIAGLPDFNNFSDCSINDLNSIRNIMFQKERSLQSEIQLA
jgi:glycosyltransferase involved in cell wall biosynthesis